MKRIQTTCIALLFGAMTTVSFANNPSNGSETIQITDAMEAKVISIAKDNGFITEREAATLTESQAMQRCVDAFIASGCKPSAAVDKLSEIAVEQGYFKSKREAKRAMRRAAEQARKSETLWSRLYEVLGL